MRIRQHDNHIFIDQGQYIKNLISRFEKTFKHPIDIKDFPNPLILYQVRGTAQ